MPMLVGDIIKRQARINAKKVGLIDANKRLTYKEINERVNRLGKRVDQSWTEEGR